MKPKLSQFQRIVVAGVYLALLVVVFQVVGGNLKLLAFDNSLDSSIWFYAGALMIILGSYVVEPYFAKPSDVIANTSAAIIALLGITNKGELVGYAFMLALFVSLLLLSVVSILLKDSVHSRAKKVTYWVATNLGSAKFVFSLIYLSAAYSYYGSQDDIAAFICLLAFWFAINSFDVVGLVVYKLTSLNRYLKGQTDNVIGQAIGHDNPLLFRAETDSVKHKGSSVKYGDLVMVETSTNVGSIGMVINIKQLLAKKWLTIYLLQDDKGEVLTIGIKDMKLVTDSKSIFASEHYVYPVNLSDLEEGMQGVIRSNQLYKNRNGFIGYVANGSNISTVNFLILRDLEECSFRLNEGSILKTSIYGEEVLYQVINGNTKEEHLENFDTYGYTVGVARKLGKYDNKDKALNTIKWMPSIYSPVFLAFEGQVEEGVVRQIAKTAIGRLPETGLEVPIKNIHETVTHNTAILGILGIGKSKLSNELIKKVYASGIPVIVVDITNEYAQSLKEYVDESMIVADDINAFNELNSSFSYIYEKDRTKDYRKSGNEADYRKVINKDLTQFFFGADQVPDGAKAFTEVPQIKVYNPDYHKVSKGEKVGIGVITVELTQAEKLRIIATELFRILMQIGVSPDQDARVLLVLEEAHSLIPEWNSVSSEGDKSATNGTAKVVLQGRKYGLGTLVITQRTANISKSVLNQCNTIFALRVFDDTGKSFLENYIGGDYAAILPTLEERHAIAIGKGLELKQPVIIQLNDMKHVVKPLKPKKKKSVN